MKKVLMIFIIAVVLSSCIDKDDVKTTKVDLVHIEPFTTKIAPIKDDSITVVKVDTTVICATTIPMEYDLPKGSTETIEYYPLNESNAKKYNLSKGYENGGVDKGTGTGYSQFMACYEDTKNGDNDYNDFVCAITKHVDVDNSNGNHSTHTMQVRVYVKPIALGAGGYKDSLAFGVKFSDGTVWMATDNIRRDFFNNDEPYINTRADQVASWSGSYVVYNIVKRYVKTFYNLTTQNNSNSANSNLARISPFVINKATHDTIYVAVENHNDELYTYSNVISTKGIPYGLAISTTNGPVRYPLEKVSIATAYPRFGKWLSGQIQEFPKSQGVSGYIALSNIVYYLIGADPESTPYYWITKH